MAQVQNTSYQPLFEAGDATSSVRHLGFGWLHGVQDAVTEDRPTGRKRDFSDPGWVASQLQLCKASKFNTPMFQADATIIFRVSRRQYQIGCRLVIIKAAKRPRQPIHAEGRSRSWPASNSGCQASGLCCAANKHQRAAAKTRLSTAPGLRGLNAFS